MSMIEDIKRDREAGTAAGPKGGATEWFINTESNIGDGFYVSNMVDREICRDVEILEDARRIARVPEMEAALIAADGLADAYETYASRANADMPEDWAAMDNALAAYRAATGAA